MPAATAAAAPPLDPPALRVRSQGFLVGPHNRDSVEVDSPSSEVWVLPKMTNPAASCLRTISES
jgi:hypothetical protein